MDEEELLNNAPPQAASRVQIPDEGSPGGLDSAEAESSSAFLYEPETPKHRPQEPSLLVLAMFDQVSAESTLRRNRQLR